MERTLPAISPAERYARLGAASASTVVDIWRRANLATAGELAETHNWPATAVKQASHG
jgi:hypothetical protein